jgi:hypothetical protein
MDNYFVISKSEGDTFVVCISKQILLERIEEEYYGRNITFLDKLPANVNTNYWNNCVLIIKGKVVEPVEKTVVTEYDID